MFNQSSINVPLLKERAFNLRWASVPEDVIPLTAADPDFPCAPEIADAISNYAKDRYFSYGHPEGQKEFKESMSAYFNNKRSIPCTPGLLFPVDSAAFGIWLTCKAFLKSGEEALIFDPVDFLFRYSIESVNAIAIPFAIPPGTNDIDFTHFESLVNKNTRMICLCNPLNPTGKVFTQNELLQISTIAIKHNLIILSDEIWSDIIFTPHVYTSIASINEETRQRTITITGFSKSYGLAGLRIGAVMASNQAHFALLMAASLHNSTIHGANILSQVAASTALNHCTYWLDGFVQHLQKARDLCVTELNSIPGFSCIAPEGCYVAFANITGTNKTSSEIHELLLTKARVAVVPGLKQWFGDGAEGYIRLSFATSEEILKTALLNIKNVTI